MTLAFESTITSPARSFVPASLAFTDFAAIEPLFRALADRDLHSPADLEQWLLDRSELEAVLAQESAKRYITMTCHTDDAAAEKAYLHWVEDIQPKCKPHWQKLDEKYLATPHRAGLDKHRYEVLDRNTANDVALFREANIPLQTEEAKLDQEYNKISGGITVYFDGSERTLPQMARFLEEPDRAKRQAAWEAVVTARMQHRDAFDRLLDGQIKLRDQMARNAGLTSYVEYAFRMYRRFDYTPADCALFHAAMAETVVPLMKKIQQRRLEKLKLPALRPWDLSVDPHNRPPLRPFENADQLCDGCQRIFDKLDADLAGQFAAMRTQKLLDLESRKGKAPGGYQYTLEEIRRPFIFMNAAGMHGDVITLLHEAGHAFHAIAAEGEPLVAYRSAPIEFCEVASMSMELFAADYMTEFYTQEERDRAVRKHLQGIVGLLPWIAQIDAFQHWLYTHPDHTHDQRNAAWLELDAKLSGGIVDWSAYEPVHHTSWQRQRHLWGNPFYYIEYGIAQLGALQLWSNYRKDPKAAIKAYRRALGLGGSRPLPELFEAAEIRFAFDPKTLAPLMQQIEGVLENLPE